MKRALVSRRLPVRRRPAQAAAAAPPPLRLRHYKHVYWMLNGGPWATAYHAVVVHDGCHGCPVCAGTTDWFMEFARVARDLLGINLRDCLHWGPLHDNPRPLIAPASNLDVCNRGTLERLRKRVLPPSRVGAPQDRNGAPGLPPDDARPCDSRSRWRSSPA